MICDPLASNSGVHHIKYPFLVARIMIEVRSRRGWRVRSIFVEMNFGIADWQVHELGREPRQTQQNPEQQFPDVYQRVRVLAAASMRYGFYSHGMVFRRGLSSVCETASYKRQAIELFLRWKFARIRNMSPESETGFL